MASSAQHVSKLRIVQHACEARHIAKLNYLIVAKKCTQVAPRPRRTCTENIQGGAYCDFLFSDDDGSDTEEDSVAMEDGEAYNPAEEGASQYNEKLGEDKWLGRRILKTFGDHGDFQGIIYAIDDDANNDGYRLFSVHYFDDPDDGEAMWPEEVFQ